MVLNQDGSTNSETHTGHLYVMRTQNNSIQEGENTASFSWRVFFSPLDLSGQNTAVAFDDLFFCSGITDIVHVNINENDTVFNQIRLRPDFTEISDCSGSFLDGSFTCTTDINTQCTNEAQVTVNVEATSLGSMAPAMANPFEVRLSTNTNTTDIVTLNFGALSMLSTQGSEVELHERLDLSVTLIDTTASTLAPKAQGYVTGGELHYESNFTPVIEYGFLSGNYYLTVDHLSPHDTMCAPQELEPGYTIGKIIISEATLEGDYLNGDYLGTIITGNDYYVNQNGTPIAHSRTDATPSPYASFYNAEVRYLIIYNESVSGWQMSFHGDGIPSSYDWENAGDSLYFQPGIAISGWETLGGTTGQYPSGTAGSEEFAWHEDYGTVNYEVVRDVTSKYAISTGDNDPVLLFEDFILISNNISYSADYRDGFCIKPVHQEVCDINSCTHRTLMHASQEGGILSLSLSNGSAN